MSRIRTNVITNRMANGAPTVSNGLVISGVTTTSDVNVGAGVTLNVYGGATFSGIVTASSFSGIDTDKISEGNTEVETIDTGSDGHIKFTTEGTEKLRINSSGRLLIGTNSSLSFNGAGGNHNLVVAGDSNDTDITDNYNAAITISNKDGTANNTAGLHFAREDTDGNPHYDGASVVAQFKETMNTGQYPKADLVFLTSSANNAAPSEKLRIDSSGRLYTGGSTQTLDSTAGSLHISGGTAGGRIAFRGTTTSANAGLAEVFAFWDTNKVAGMIAKSGTDTTNKDDGSLHFYTNTGSGISERCSINAGGHFHPNLNSTYDLGISGKAWRNLYVNDAHFSNEGHSNSVDGTWGSWTLQEGENDIFMINNRTGKKFAITMKEVN